MRSHLEERLAALCVFFKYMLVPRGTSAKVELLKVLRQHGFSAREGLAPGFILKLQGKMRKGKSFESLDLLRDRL